MPTVAQIEAARTDAVRELDFQIIEAISRRNASSSEKTQGPLDRCINRMMKTRTRLNAAAVAAQDNSDEMRNALATLEQATLVLNRVAEHQKKLADFINLASAFTGAAAKLADAMKKPKQKS
jgi:hypothetical protein